MHAYITHAPIMLVNCIYIMWKKIRTCYKNKGQVQFAQEGNKIKMGISEAVGMTNSK